MGDRRMIDSHQHFWRLSRGDYHWMSDAVAPIRRDYLPADLAPHRAACGVAQSIAVQAAETLAETAFLLALAEAEPSVAAVVGWVDFTSADALATLELLKGSAKFVGVRPMLQDMADAGGWLFSAPILERVKGLQSLGLRFDALVRAHQLGIVAALADAAPELPIVLDHAGKPPIAAGVREPWARDLAALAQRPNVSCKLSGLVTEAGADKSAAALSFYATHVLACFGPARVMWGSDWPVLELASSYADWFATTRTLTQALSESERADVFGGAARRFYGL
jgi:L-fucono-1,5-lactonase